MRDNVVAEATHHNNLWGIVGVKNILEYKTICDCQPKLKFIQNGIAEFFFLKNAAAAEALAALHAPSNVSVCVFPLVPHRIYASYSAVSRNQWDSGPLSGN